MSLENNAIASLPSHSALEDAIAFHGRIFKHPAYGRIYVLAPDGPPEGKPKIVINTLRDIRAAKAYGPVHAEKMDLVIVFETKQGEVTYYALYHIGESKFRGQRHLILRTVQGDDLVDAASSVSDEGRDVRTGAHANNTNRLSTSPDLEAYSWI